jgi:hypothetical protein
LVQVLVLPDPVHVVVHVLVWAMTSAVTMAKLNTAAASMMTVRMFTLLLPLSAREAPVNSM